jgi:hypothetical protein
LLKRRHLVALGFLAARLADQLVDRRHSSSFSGAAFAAKQKEAAADLGPPFDRGGFRSPEIARFDALNWLPGSVFARWAQTACP